MKCRILFFWKTIDLFMSTNRMDQTPQSSIASYSAVLSDHCIGRLATVEANGRRRSLLSNWYFDKKGNIQLLTHIDKCSIMKPFVPFDEMFWITGLLYAVFSMRITCFQMPVVFEDSRGPFCLGRSRRHSNFCVLHKLKKFDAHCKCIPCYITVTLWTKTAMARHSFSVFIFVCRQNGIYIFSRDNDCLFLNRAVCSKSFRWNDIMPHQNSVLIYLFFREA